MLHLTNIYICMGLFLDSVFCYIDLFFLCCANSHAVLIIIPNRASIPYWSYFLKYILAILTFAFPYKFQNMFLKLTKILRIFIKTALNLQYIWVYLASLAH